MKNLDKIDCKAFYRSKVLGVNDEDKRPPSSSSAMNVEKAKTPSDQEANSPACLVKRIKKHLMVQYGLNGAKVDSLIAGLTESLFNYLDYADKSLAQGDLEAVKKTGHSLKGSLQTLGLTNWANIALRLERLETRERDRTIHEGLHDQLLFLRKEFKQLIH